MATSPDTILASLQGRRLILDFDGVVTHLPVNWATLEDKLIQSFKLPVNTTIAYVFQYAVATGQKARFLNMVGQTETEAATRAPVSPLFGHLIKIRLPFSMMSGNTRAAIISFLHRYQAYDLCEKLVAADDVTFMKPHPEGLVKIAGKHPDSFVFIGDQLGDEIAARFAKIDFIHYSWQFF